MRFLALTALLVLAACAGTPAGLGAYDALDNQTTFRSADVPLGDSPTGSYASTADFAIRAEAVCTGKGCEPEQVELVLLNRTANETVTAYATQVIFATPDGSITIDPNQSGEGYTLGQLSNGRGEILRISIPRGIFTSFAHADMLDVRFGSSLYKLPYSARSSFRRMLEPTPAL